jgi:BMFP domain-containing protein YqiC
MTDTEFASAPYVLHQHQMALIRAAEAIGALEKRVAELEALMLYAGPPDEHPAARATSTDPSA